MFFVPLRAIAQSPHLTAVCHEALRLCIYLAHHHQKTFANFYQFLPERFLEYKFTPYEYFPFGGGHRICVGGAFSLYEMKLILATILSNYDLTLAKQKSVRPIRREDGYISCLEPLNGPFR